LLGLDLQPGGALRVTDNGPEEVDDYGRPTVRAEIINNPEIERLRWLEEERERLLNGSTDDEPTTLN
jgi:hypothetical protein